MKIEFTVTDNDGNIYTGTAELGVVDTKLPAENSANVTAAERSTASPPDVDFAKPLRPFVKEYARGLSGSQKFTLLLSWLAKGDPQTEVSYDEIQKQWEKMTDKSLLGLKFNGFFSADARNNDWVDSKKRGVYNLRPGWRNALSSKS